MDVTAALRPAQRRLGEEIRRRVAGDRADERAARIWGTEGERWFDRSDPVWRVHDDASMYASGIAALLLQSLHPAAMAGVAGHSGYREDPWGRLQRTSEYIATTTFATIEHAEAMIARVQKVHERVRGRDHRGRPYRASDPHLLRWVHVAEISSFLQGFQAYARAPLSADDADTYVAQAAGSAARLGVDDPPRTVAELHRQLDAYRPELEATPASREVVRFLLLDPPLPLVARPGFAMLVAGGVAVLPPWARRTLGLPWAPGAGLVAGGVGKVAVGAVRWGFAGLR